MSNIIHMEPEQVRLVGKQLEQTADAFYDEIELLTGRVRAIPWQSPGRENYIGAVERLKKQIHLAAQQGLELSRRIQAEANEWEDADGSFGGADSGILIGKTSMDMAGTTEAHKKPENMRVLAEFVMEGSDPIRSYEIGPNEYLMVIQGTSHDPSTSRNWGSAVFTGLGLSSDYQEQVKLALLSLPAGAVIHMAGHSQGGIVAQNLANDREISGRFQIKSITTFGTPYSSPEVDEVDVYNRYATEGDIVPYLEGRDASIVVLLSPFISPALVGTGAIANRHPQTSIPYHSSGEGIFGPHSEYSKSPELEKISGDQMPFNLSTWNGKPTSYDPGSAHSGAALAYKFGADVVDMGMTTAKSTASAIENAAWSVASTTDTAAREVGSFFGNLF